MNRQNCSLSVDMERDSAVYRIKNPDGTYREVSISSPVYNLENMPPFAEIYEIQKGLVLGVMDIPADLELFIEFEYGECPLTIGCTLECSYDMKFHKAGRLLQHDSVEGSALFISKTPGIRGNSIKWSGTPVRGINISFDPETAEMIFGEGINYVNENYKPFFSKKDFFINDIIRPSSILMSITEAILNCSCPQPRRSLYYKAKVFEFLNHVFAEQMMAPASDKKSVLQPSEVDKIKELKLYILERLENPPTITELAKISGINDFKLKAGFKQIFGTTIYGFIQSEKMSRAKRKLETGRFSVSEIAWDAGYTNVSHFIAAFKKHYGVTPGQLLVSIKNDLVSYKISAT